jgi:hypothetical protein
MTAQQHRRAVCSTVFHTLLESSLGQSGTVPCGHCSQDLSILSAEFLGCSLEFSAYRPVRGGSARRRRRFGQTGSAHLGHSSLALSHSQFTLSFTHGPSRSLSSSCLVPLLLPGHLLETPARSSPVSRHGHTASIGANSEGVRTASVRQQIRDTLAVDACAARREKTAALHRVRPTQESGLAGATSSGPTGLCLHR